MSATFAPGKTYWTRSIVDADFKVTVHVLSRTAKTIKAKTQGGEKSLRIFIDMDGNEAVRPWGNYSMCPIVDASRTLAA